MDKMPLQDDILHLQLVQQIFSRFKLAKCLNSVEFCLY